MQVHIIPADDIIIKSNRQRRDLDQTKILELAGSISENGLINPITVREHEGEYTLVAGERRMKALQHLWFLGTTVTYGDYEIPEGHVPCNFLGEIDPIDAEEIELEENIRREDLNWKDRADAITRLAALRIKQADAVGAATPTIADITREVDPSAAGIPTGDLGQRHENIREELIVGRALKDPEKAAVIQNATTRKEAVKLLKRFEESQKNAALGAAIGSHFSSSLHTLRQGDCIPLMSEMPAEAFDVICTDPPYGIGADEFGDSGGKATAGGHFYDDSYETWCKLIVPLARESFRLAKKQSHCYVFCDIDRFTEQRELFSEAGWKVFRTPLIWVNPGAMRAPWPEMGPWRKYQLVMFAVKGDRPVTRLYSDVLTHAVDSNLGHAAQKPVALISDLLIRSIRPGDSVFDPFCGTGSVFPAAHHLKCAATGIEMNESAYGISVKRIQELDQ